MVLVLLVHRKFVCLLCCSFDSRISECMMGGLQCHNIHTVFCEI